MSERLNIEQAKEYWFGGDLTVYADIGHNETVIAMPAQELTRGWFYLEKLKACSSYEQAENLYLQYKNDPDRPKLIPKIINPLDDFEYVDHLFTDYLNKKGIDEAEHLDYVDQQMGLRDFMEKSYRGNWLPHEYEYEYRSMAEHIVRTEVPFIWNSARPYLDDNGLFAGCRDAERWTDEWMPAEITEAIGSPDTGFGIDYYEAQYVYTDIKKLQSEFKKYGFNLVSNDEKFFNLFTANSG